ncbi:hypothetical protein BB559_004208 [Furculomyces boomerangus]|uniref:Uncharacterized protein n=2 Tax=Harpellales TaxID=61421 RepID=A0A2T9YG14_9FUNG|nr:hypothetical protein BB559_004208 [Furculomyces boomerangus]
MSVVGMIPYGGVSFLTHNFFVTLGKTKFADIAVLPKKETSGSGGLLAGKRNKHRKTELRAWAELTAGGLSGVFAQTCSYPFELVRRRLQVSGSNNPEKKIKMIQVAKSIYSTQGFGGFFVGLTIGYVKVLPMFAVSFYTYAKLKSFLDIE